MSADSSLSPHTPPWWRRALRFCLGFEPMYHAWWEMLLMRSGIAYVAWQTLRGHSPFMSQPTPHGFATWGLDFSWIGNEALSHYLIPLWGVCLFLYALGLVPSLTLLPPLIASIAHGTLGNSQGGIGHTTQIVTAVLLAAWVASLWSLFCAKTGRKLPHGYNANQLGLDWSRQVIMATYVASAITKCLESEGGWLSDTPYFALQIVKATESAYYNYLVPADNAVWLAQALIDHPTLAKLLIGAALPLELFAFLGLLNRRSALFFGLALIGFHSSVTEVMNLGFVYHKSLLLGLFVNPVWWAVQAVERLKRLKLKS